VLDGGAFATTEIRRKVERLESDELTEQAETLRCAECGTTTLDGIGWRAALTVGDEDAEDEEQVAVFCPECAARELDGP
jgi:Zn finger protein HypA/HybF involved in hydrogenase expression